APDVPNHRFTLADALKGYTLGGAYAERSEAFKGSLEIGKVADLVVLDRDIMRIEDHDQIKDMKVMTTICSGRIVFRHDA
ncbi:MAG: amidohydrolase family protein, partial [Hoeflea sp.]|nr:amidohydrolase family protein [Hoeflea sp.]